MAALAARAGTGACPYGCYEIFDEVLTFINIPCIIIKTGRKICYNIIGYNTRLKLLLNFACKLRKFSFP
ncbi:Uncharacterized protein dnl_22490 [Desulfonema limicola]|uniref:Uncharacterized protein n=1 Tax=Desulfonema limicola TaxID=45656 RepID=A0A975GG74_9BACT|nr:hypothetical protein [Desulfonema limicola]QTA79964.1 Uncharacterized protein dnl_22490 [Desulfonema limicola]